MWNLIINGSILMLWFFMIAFARPRFHRLHNRWFPMSEEDFIRCHYFMYGGYKLAILVFNAAPYIVLELMV